MQALSSYVFIAANIILHGEKTQFGHLDELLPPIIPLLTSHHHTLRGFTQVTLHQMENVFLFVWTSEFCNLSLCIMQVLVYHVLVKMLPDSNPGACSSMSLERKCFVDLRYYLAQNSDCAR